MKKILLSALLGVFGFVGAFTSAENFSFVGTEDYYDPSEFTTDGGIVSDFVNNGSDCVFSVDFDGNGIDNFGNGTELVSGTYSVGTNGDYACSSVSFTVSQEGGSEGGSSGGGFVDGNNGGLLSGGTSQLSGIITNLGNVISEFIPYVAYLGLGLLGVIIGFVAVKRLINWFRAKVFGTFSGGRRR